MAEQFPRTNEGLSPGVRDTRSMGPGQPKTPQDSLNSCRAGHPLLALFGFVVLTKTP